MSQENYILSVFNTITGKAEDIGVDEAIYNGCRRSGWAIRRNDDRFRENEIPFSDLKGGIDGAYENFDEFRSEANDPASLVIQQLTQQQLRTALDLLDEPDQELLRDLFERGMTEREIAAVQGVSQNVVHRKKQRIIRHLKNILF
jgi:RNA polymerase sigma factor (sigma-70 family)